jgi:hypothetical protein
MFNPVVQETNSYELRINLVENIDDGTWFEVTLPDQWSKVPGIDSDCDVKSYYDELAPIDGTYYCETVG